MQENTRRTAQVNTHTVLEKNGTLGGKEKLNIHTEEVWKITKYRVLHIEHASQWCWKETSDQLSHSMHKHSSSSSNNLTQGSGCESFLEFRGLDFYACFLLSEFISGSIVSLHKMSLGPNEWIPKVTGSSRADNATAFRQAQKIPAENQLSSDFQIFHKNQIKSSGGALFWFWNIYKSMKSRRLSSYLNQNRDFCSLEIKKYVSTRRSLFGQELILLLKHVANISQQISVLWKLKIIHFTA